MPAFRQRVSLVLAAVVLLLAAPAPAVAAGQTFDLTVHVIQGTTSGSTIDPKLNKLAKALAGFKKFSSYSLLDLATFKLANNAKGRMQLPGGQWATVWVREVNAKGLLRVDIEVKDVELKTTVAIAPGGVVMVPGPAHGGGRIIFAVGRAKGDK